MAKRKRGSAVQAIGGALVGFDHQIMRSVPPPHEAVRKGDRLPAVPADDGGTLEIGFPDDRPRPAAEADEPV